MVMVSEVGEACHDRGLGHFEWVFLAVVASCYFWRCPLLLVAWSIGFFQRINDLRPPRHEAKVYNEKPRRRPDHSSQDAAKWPTKNKQILVEDLCLRSIYECKRASSNLSLASLRPPLVGLSRPSPTCLETRWETGKGAACDASCGRRPPDNETQETQAVGFETTTRERCYYKVTHLGRIWCGLLKKIEKDCDVRFRNHRWEIDVAC